MGAFSIALLVIAGVAAMTWGGAMVVSETVAF